MSAATAPRFVVVESSGYRINVPIEAGHNARLITEVLVLDSEECYAVVWSSERAVATRTRRKGGYRNGRKRAWYRNVPLAERRERAAEVAAELNAAAA